MTVFEAHRQAGGCAGTFRRGPWIFDVGATQVAGLEPGGSHARIFQHLNLPLPGAELLDPGCVVDLADGSAPVRLWHDPQRWQKERQQHFPGSERFWQLCSFLHQSNWQFAGSDPVLPIRNGWDLKQTLAAELKKFPDRPYGEFVPGGNAVPGSGYDEVFETLRKVAGGKKKKK